MLDVTTRSLIRLEERTLAREQIGALARFRVDRSREHSIRDLNDLMTSFHLGNIAYGRTGAVISKSADEKNKYCRHQRQGATLPRTGKTKRQAESRY